VGAFEFVWHRPSFVIVASFLSTGSALPSYYRKNCVTKNILVSYETLQFQNLRLWSQCGSSKYH